MKPRTRNEPAPVYYYAAERRRRFETISEIDVSPKPTVKAGSATITPVSSGQLPEALVAPPACDLELCVTQSLGAIPEEHGFIDGVRINNVPSVEQARVSPISVLLTCRAQTPPRDKKYQARLHATAAAAYAAYCEIERSDELWREFADVANAYQTAKRPIRGKDRPKALLLVMRFVFGWSHDYDRAYKLARGLELCQLRKLEPENILPELERKGIEKLYQTACEKLPYRGKTANEKALMRMDYEPAAAVDFFADLDDGSNRKKAAKPPATTEAELKRGGDNLLYIEVSDEQLSRILACSEHQLLSVWFESAGTLADGWRRFVAVKVDEVETSGRTVSD
ncbi:hypothetical protein FJV76_14115 [Mesorhizobium sp. WSM4303]|uniref:hypothetical protein n=1 Tax=Mesorhizobium sp. WSM4303 TaxID=2589887 RepID=UPI00115F180A|nr:hypothetical protein [Mesorhizobium sp. WSM4303]TRD03772.1 hypothetical protein FJV76_14115 [Mesorhizobium sp. WSM4303]